MRRWAAALLIWAACGHRSAATETPAAGRQIVQSTPAPARLAAPPVAPPHAEARDSNGRTALHDAAQAGELEKMKALLDGGADLEAVENIYRDTPLLLALEYSEPEAAALLLARGARTDGDVGGRALLLAARGGADAVLETLLARGIAAKGSFAMHAAARYGNTRAVELLLAAGEPVDEVEPNDRWTPLLVACMENQPAVARVLLSAGASVKVRDDDGNLALHWAVFGARPNEIHEYPAMGGPHDTYFEPQADAPLVKLLLAHKAAVDAVDGDGDTALHRAAMYDAYSATEALLAGGANRALRNRDGKTALELARDRHNSVVALLARP